MIAERSSIREGPLPRSGGCVRVAEGVEGLRCGDRLRRVGLRFGVLDSAVVIRRRRAAALRDSRRVARGRVVDDGRNHARAVVNVGFRYNS